MSFHCLCLNAYFYLTRAIWSFLYLLLSSLGFLPILLSLTQSMFFLFLKTGPHASEEKVVHYFIPTFSSVLASLRPAMPRSASTQAGPSNQLSQQFAFYI